MLIKPNYMEGYKITQNMRAILVDWLVEMHLYYQTEKETLYRTVAIVDGFLQKIEPTYIQKDEVQVVGMSSMFIASKFEENKCLDINELVASSDNAYSKKEILNRNTASSRHLTLICGDRYLSIFYIT